MICLFFFDQLSLEGEVFSLRHLEGEGAWGGGEERKAGATLAYQNRTVLDLLGLVFGVAYHEVSFGGNGFEGESTVGAVEEVEGGGGSVYTAFKRHDALGIVGEVRESLMELFLGGFDDDDVLGGFGVLGFDIAKTTRDEKGDEESYDKIFHGFVPFENYLRCVRLGSGRNDPVGSKLGMSFP